jgi:hypothetical protein
MYERLGTKHTGKLFLIQTSLKLQRPTCKVLIVKLNLLAVYCKSRSSQLRVKSIYLWT